MMLLLSRSSMMQRLLILKMLSRSWVTTTKVRPSCSFRLRISSSNSTAETGSRPAEGSSRKSRSGSSAIARAIPARLHIPPDSSLGIWSSARCRPTSRSLAATMPPMASGGSPLQANQIAQQGRLAATAAAEDGENGASLDLEGGVLLHDGLVPADGEIDHLEQRVAHRPATRKKTVITASARMRVNMVMTTVEVVRRPTPSAPPLV